MVSFCTSMAKKTVVGLIGFKSDRRKPYKPFQRELVDTDVVSPLRRVTDELERRVTL